MVCTMSDPYAWLGAGCYHALSTTVFLDLGQQCVQQFLLNLLLKSTFSPRNQDSQKCSPKLNLPQNISLTLQSIAIVHI